MKNLWSYFPRWMRLPGATAPASAAAERWRATLRAASDAPYYSKWRRELNRAAHAASDEERRAALLRLPEVELDYFFSHFRQFKGRESGTPLAREARGVWGTECRVAVIAPWFHVGGPARLFLTPEADELQKFAPEVMAAPVDVLETLAGRGEWRQEPPLFALVALCGVGTPLLTGAIRESLWRSLGVPVYVQLRGFQGEPLARECEAHNGLHMDPAEVIVERRPSGELLLTSLANPRHTVLRLATRLHAWLDMRPCGCGLTTPRLMDLQPAAAQTITYRAPAAASLTALAGAVGEAEAAWDQEAAER